MIEITKNNREDWLEWRRTGIGSSDASVIMEVSRFKTIDELVQEKAQGFKVIDQSNAYIKDRGNKIEVQVREYLEKQTGLTYSPLNCMHDHFSFMKASLDGITIDRSTIVEIKLLSVFNPEKPNKEASGYVKWEKACQGKVPEEYYPQIQHQLAVTGATTCIFLGYKEVKGDLKVTDDKLAWINVGKDKEYIRTLMKKEFEFWLDVLDKRDILKYKGELE
jgi:putative phage-type endonuclease